uniref:RING-type domain-containing protein n=1 Tax=Aegilops tauschii subsp. strangulata TaxID=200361 RepID=A0A453P2J1_AEGTS
AAASLAPVSGRVLEDYVNEGVIAVTAGAEARRGGGRKNSSSAPLPPSAAAPAPASGRALEEYVNVASLAASPEVHHGGGKDSSAPLHSAATAVHAPAPGVKLEDYVNVCAVSATAYPEARRSGGKKPSSAQLPSAVALLPAAAPAPDLMLEDYVNKGVVSITAHPEVRRGSGKRSSSARSPLSPAATVLALASGRSLKDYVKEWEARKVASGASLQHCVLPFLTGAPKAVECRVCYKIIHPLEEIKCSVSRCEQMFHLTCVVEYTANFTAESFRCPQHVS